MRIDLGFIQLTAGDEISQQQSAIMKAVDKTQAIIEFDVNGHVITANENFLQLMEYQHDEVIGKHHKIFVDSATASSKEYRDFWQQLASGSAQTAEFKRVKKSGHSIWLQANYTPIYNKKGQVCKDSVKP